MTVAQVRVVAVMSGQVLDIVQDGASGFSDGSDECEREKRQNDATGAQAFEGWSCHHPRALVGRRFLRGKTTRSVLDVLNLRYQLDMQVEGSTVKLEFRQGVWAQSTSWGLVGTSVELEPASRSLQGQTFGVMVVLEGVRCKGRRW